MNAAKRLPVLSPESPPPATARQRSVRRVGLVLVLLCGVFLGTASPVLAAPAPTSPTTTPAPPASPKPPAKPPTKPTPPPPGGGGSTNPSPPSGVVNNCSGNQIFYFFRYNDSATVGVDKGCSSSIDVYRTAVPTLIATYLHVSCSDNIDVSTGIPQKSQLGSSTRRVAAYYIQKPDGKSCGFGNPSTSSTQTIQAEIYQCVNGAPTGTLASGGTVAVPALSLSSSNPGPATAVAAGTYTVTAAAPSGQQFVACGQSGVTITDSSNAQQSVTVPAGGAGDGKFYVQAVAVSHGYLEICKSSANGVSGTFGFTVAGQTVTVPAGACTPALRVPAGTQVVHELASTGYFFSSASTYPSNRLLSTDAAGSNASVTIVAGGVSTQTILTVVNTPFHGVLKVCQVAGSGVADGTVFTFTNSANGASVSVPAGAQTGGYCVVLDGTFTGGSTVTITQTAKSGYGVSDISVEPSSRVVGSPDLSGRKVSILVGSSVTEVTFTDVAVGVNN